MRSSTPTSAARTSYRSVVPTRQRGLTFERMTITPATQSDVTALAHLVNSAYRGQSSRVGWTTEADLLGGQRTDESALRDFLAAPPDSRLMLTARTSDALVACVQLERRGETAYLGMLTVSPQLQSGGIGRRLLEAAEQAVRLRWESRAVEMTVIAQRPELIAWYERRGYRRTGETAPFPYGEPRFGLPRRPDLHFVVLRKSLTAVQSP